MSSDEFLYSDCREKLYYLRLWFIFNPCSHLTVETTKLLINYEELHLHIFRMHYYNTLPYNNNEYGENIKTNNILRQIKRF